MLCALGVTHGTSHVFYPLILCCHALIATGSISLTAEANVLILRHQFSPSSNTRLGNLCGALDEHLRTIESALQVKIAHSHEKFKIDGNKANAIRALELLQALYERAAKPIPKEHVQLMLAGDSRPSTDSQVVNTRRNEVRARTPTQGLYLDNIANHDITFGIGPAGTGKTFLAVASAVEALERSAVQRIILTRPAVEAGEPTDITLCELAGSLDGVELCESRGAVGGGSVRQPLHDVTEFVGHRARCR